MTLVIPPVVGIIIIALGILSFFYTKIKLWIRWPLVILAFLSIGIFLLGTFSGDTGTGGGGNFNVYWTNTYHFLGLIIIGIPLIIILFKYKLKKEKHKK